MQCTVIFVSDSLTSVWGQSVHLQKFPVLRFSSLLLSQFSSNFNQTLKKTCNRAKYRLTFLAICQILKAYGTLKRSYISCITAIIPKAICWFHVAKGEAGPRALVMKLKSAEYP